ncbi:Sensor protein kinase WalK [Paenibacillus nuruki]|uniref:histidine kinase n=1 Tax=Paenibacillus nuruki TaxID=1886670 RepID=A0A1E3KZ04_9BACL|nr:ATP-binding protein [Paenibacillus nuruki]ODP26135.1 Sensor protein kinase WalK [Paenibacillus nuruki]
MKYRILLWFRSPWIGTIILTILGIAGNYFKWDLSLNLRFALGSAALLIIFRLYGLRFAVPALLAINIPFGFGGSYLFMTGLFGLEILFLYFYFKWFNKGILFKGDLLFWGCIGLPLVFLMYQYRLDEMGIKMMTLVILEQSFNSIINLLIASILLESIISRIKIDIKPTYTISLGRIIFKYLIAFVIFTSLLLLTVSSHQQFQDIRGLYSSYLERSSYIYKQDIEGSFSDMRTVKPLMNKYKKNFYIDSVLVSPLGSSMYSTLDNKTTKQLVQDGSYESLMIKETADGARIFHHFPLNRLTLIERWQESYFVMDIPLNHNYRLLLKLTAAFYLERIYIFYIQSIITILIVIGIAILLARPISRKITKPLLELAKASNNIPRKLVKDTPIDWPNSNISEFHALIENFKLVSLVLENQFLQIQRDKENLEIRVVERTFDLAESESQKRAILKYAINGIISTDHQMKITEFNPAAEQMFKYSREQVIGRPLSDLLVIDTSQQEDSNHSITAIRSDDTPFQVELTRSEILAEESSFQTFFVHDLTQQEKERAQRNEHERQLEALNDRLREEQGVAEKQKSITGNLLESVQEGIVMCDSKGIISFINPTMLSLFKIKDYTGYSVQQLLHHIEDQLIEGTSSWIEKLEQFLNGEPHWNQGELVLLKNEKILSLYVTPVTDTVQQIEHGVILVFRDRTEEEQVKQMQNELISVVSHELRTPLSAMMGYIEMLMIYQDMSIEKRHTFIETIHQEGQRLSHLLDDFLDIQRIEADHAEYHMTYIPLYELLQGICHQWNPDSRDRIILHHEGVDEVFITGDHHRLIQVFQNLISNALKYSSAESLVHIVIEELPHQIRVSIEDSGIGIPVEDQARIFQKFFRASSASEHQIKGTGLGLYITQRIVNDHKGELSFVSRPNEGSVFSVLLPKPKKNDSAHSIE